MQKKVYVDNKIPISTLRDRIKNVVESCFQGKRIVIFSGGSAKNVEGLLNEIREIYNGGGFGSIIGRNSFQRPKKRSFNPSISDY